VPWCRARLGTRLRIGPQGKDGWVDVELRGHSAGSLAADIAGFGSAIELLDPPEVRAELAKIGAQLTDAYAR